MKFSIVLILIGLAGAAIVPPVGVILISLPCCGIGLYRIFSQMINEAKEKARESATEKLIEDLPLIKNRMNELGVDVEDCQTLDDCVRRFNSFTDAKIANKNSELIKRYGLSSTNKNNFEITQEGLVYSINFVTVKHLVCTTHEPATNIIQKINDIANYCWRIMALAKLIRWENIEYFTVKGEVRYETNVSGGGANLEGALVGGLLLGNAGAMVGSKVGTEISSSTQRIDSRELVIHCTNNLDAIIATKNEVETVLIELRKAIPEKEYSAERGFTQKPEEKLSAEFKNKTDELIELKKLLDAGIITQEEFDAKKKQLLDL